MPITFQNQGRSARILQGINIALCLLGIVYFGLQLRPADFPVSFLNVVWNLLAQALIIFPQIFLLLLMLAVEVRSKASMRGRAIGLVVIVALLFLGRFWSSRVIGAIES